MFACTLPLLQITPTSSLCPQLCWPIRLDGHVKRVVSFPWHWRLSSQIFPRPSEVAPLDRTWDPSGMKPNCLQATVASITPKRSSQTVPHRLALQTSSRPRYPVFPTILIEPWIQVSARENNNRATSVNLIVSTQYTNYYK